VAQTGDIGVGLRIDYDSGGTPKKCWIGAVLSSTQFTVVTATGGIAPTCADLGVDSIKHEYASLSAFEAGFTDANHLNDTDLTAGSADVRVWACCYDGSSDDTTAVTLNWGGTQDADHNVIVYTPFESDEVLLESQRHHGTWTSDAYILDISSGGTILTVEEAHTWVEGLQVEHGSSSAASAIYITETGCRVANCIIRQTSAAASSEGIFVADADGTDFLVFNNIVYSFTNVAISIIPDDVADTGEIYNCTVYGCASGIISGGVGDVVVKNCLAYNSSSVDFAGSTSGNSDYNLSEDGTAPGGNSIHIVTDGGQPKFFSTASGSEDFHVYGTSTAVNAGTALDPTRNYDIDEDTRPWDDEDPIADTWDIGADETQKTGTDYYLRMMEREL
jgi:hypothetical protein